MKGKAEEMYRVCKQRRKHFGDAAKKEKTKVYDTYLPLTFSKLPSGHGAHFSLPSTAAKVPGEQDLHKVEPVASAKVPGEQGVQLTPPATSW